MKLQNSFRDYTAESSLFVRRALVAFLGILLLTGVLIANLYNLQIVRFTDYQTRSNENRIKLVPIPPSRGIIYDRNGTPLALNRTIYQLEMMPEKVDNVQQTLDALRDVVDLTDDDIAGFKKSAPAPSLYLDSGKGQPQRSAGGPFCRQPVPLSRRGSQRL
jgi:penicillin-binding protein 2